MEVYVSMLLVFIRISSAVCGAIDTCKYSVTQLFIPYTYYTR